MGRLRQIPSRLKAMPPKVKPLPKVADPFYQSPEWRGLVRDIKRQRGAFCVTCGSGKRIIGDHIREIKDGGDKLDANNVQLLCHACHQRKTARERAKRAVGQTG
jgi:5-methylcytosine-specific restriction protein A